jgi:predicted Zn finger-like uncharacterized protein
MASITQCPACGTRFRVVPDQLKISQGWVRCGKCSEVFDARSAMGGAAPAGVRTPTTAVPSQVSIVLRQESRVVPESEPVLPPEPAPKAVDVPPPPAEVPPLDVPRFLLSMPRTEPSAAFKPPVSLPAVAVPSAPSDFSPTQPQVEDTLTDASVEPEAAPDTQPLAEPLAATEVSPGAEPTPPPESTEDTPPAEPDGLDGADALPPDEPAPVLDTSRIGFVRQARRQAFWQRPWVVGGLGMGALVLALTLAAQVAFDQRDWLAAAVPELRPALNEVCQRMGCAVEPWRHIESVSIDSSALVRERDGVYRLEVGLKSQAHVPVALPALELSLTDAQDDVAVRRVLLPDDWSAPQATLPPQTTTVLSVRLGLKDLRSAGYRVLVFYP